ncbi:uncharacterized protein METZ01_LOCUS503377, partial [marine metagenome]
SISLGLLIPLIALVLDPELLFSYSLVKQIIYYFEIPSETYFAKLLFIVIIIFYLIKLIYLMFFTWIKNVFVNNFQLRIATDLFTKYINETMKFHNNHNSSILHQYIISETNNIQIVILELITLFTEILILLLIFLFLLYLHPSLVLFISLVIIIGISIFYLFFYKKIKLWGKNRLIKAAKSTQHVFQTFSAIKDIKILNSEKFFTNKFFYYFSSYVKMNKLQNILQGMPRIWL